MEKKFIATVISTKRHINFALNENIITSVMENDLSSQHTWKTNQIETTSAQIQQSVHKII